MSAWLSPLREALDGADRPVPFFLRDDDAGWGDAALWPLLDRLRAALVPVDVAVIPAAAGQALVAGLNRRRAEVANGRRLLEVHQHGWTHRNHEPAGRKCEFGSARQRSEQLTDLVSGRVVMTDAFGPDAVQIFVPPWNRCTSLTAQLVHELGFTALSRDVTAGPAGIAGLRELPVTVDWFAKRRGGGAIDREGRGELLAAAVRSCLGHGDEAGTASAVGVMLHHAEAGAADLTDISELAVLLAAHDRAVPTSMTELLS